MIIIDDFIKDEEMISKIQKDEDFWKEGYRWWSGWWASNVPMQTRHELIETIWRTNCPEQLRGLSLEGFEHWTGILSKDKIITNGDAINKGYALNHHFDKDEAHWHQTGEIKGPKLGTVYYPPMNEPQCEGGYLKIYDTHEMDLTAPYELIAPVPNRLVIFDACKLHAVTEITKGKRYAIAINLWDEKPDMTEMLESL